jgi:hypothetical protein
MSICICPFSIIWRLSLKCIRNIHTYDNNFDRNRYLQLAFKSLIDLNFDQIQYHHGNNRCQDGRYIGIRYVHNDIFPCLIRNNNKTVYVLKICVCFVHIVSCFIILPREGPFWSWSHGIWIYNYIWNQCLSRSQFESHTGEA